MKQVLILMMAIYLISCQQEPAIIYLGDNYSVFSDKVVQDEYTAQVHSSTHITSDYQSPANATFSNFIEFKFAINGKDNELPIGVNHTFLLQVGEDGAINLPTLKFGERHADEVSAVPTGSLEPNTQLIIKVDASAVVKSFDDKGYYESYNGQKIYKEDYNGIYIAGNLAPLGWDFDNLNGRVDRQLTDDNNDGIFEITLSMNPYNPDDFTANDWTLQNDISTYAQFHSSIPLVDALYNMALDETEMNIEDDGTFRTGEEWPGVWTRDVSYSILLAYAFTNTEVAKTSLMRKVKNNRIIQDTGTGGAWPVSSDRTTWTLAAWEIYKVTGDQQWLETIYPIITNSVEDDLQTLKDGRSKLIKGESSFLDWRKQTYPVWMNGVDIFESRCLGTNAVHAQTYSILAEMARLMGDDASKYQHEAQLVVTAINTELWMEEKGYYAQYLYGRNHLQLSPRSEALGEAFAVLFNIADSNRAKQVVAHTPVVDYGVPCIYPQIPEIPPYHNNGIWPFVQAYWNWACAKAGNSSALEQGLAGMHRAAALFLTNKENMVADNGDFRDTEVNSNRQLWSVAGYLSSVYRVFAGMQFELDGLHFKPFIPVAYGKQLGFTNFRYRDAILDITIKGNGSVIKLFTIDGKKTEPIVDKTLSGHHVIEIELEEPQQLGVEKKVLANSFSLKTPRITANRNKLNWNQVDEATSYEVYNNGALLTTTSDTEIITKISQGYQEFAIKAIGKDKESFLSNVVAILPDNTVAIDASQLGLKGGINANGYTGRGYIELSKAHNTSIATNINVTKAGYFLIQARYSNGSGPDNTDNKCAIRTMFINDKKVGVVVMPQRGNNEWSNWGYTNLIKTNLLKGVNTLTLQYKDYNQNMNGDVNTALLDEIRIIPVD